MVETMNVNQNKKEKYNKIIVTGLLLPKGKVSRNGVLYDWESAVSTVNMIPGLPMMYNHQVEGSEKPLGHWKDAIALESRPTNGKWVEVWDKVAEDLGIPEGVPGIYYEADVNPNSEYADSVVRGDVRKVSIQIRPKSQEKESDENGNSYTRAFIQDYVEASAVPSPGYMETTMNVMAESFQLKKVEENIDYTSLFEKMDVMQFNSREQVAKASKILEKNGIDHLPNYGKFAILFNTSQDKIHAKRILDKEMEQMTTDTGSGAIGVKMSGRDEEQEKKEHLVVGDTVDVAGKTMKVIRTTENGYIMEYPDGEEGIIPDEETSDEPIHYMGSDAATGDGKDYFESLTDEEADSLLESLSEGFVRDVHGVVIQPNDDVKIDPFYKDPLGKSGKKGIVQSLWSGNIVKVEFKDGKVGKYPAGSLLITRKYRG